MLNQPTFDNLDTNDSLAYYGQEGVKITLTVDDSLDSLIIIRDNNNNVIGEKFHRQGNGIKMDMFIYPILEGVYNISATASEVTLSNETAPSSVFVFLKNMKEMPIVIDPSTFDVITFLDLNFWFSKGTDESVFPRELLEDTTQSVGGISVWGNYQESDFLPDVFTSNSIFKLLFMDNVITDTFIDIHHRIRNVTNEEFKKLPTSLRYSLDSYYKLRSLWLSVEDTSNTMTSILIDEANEYTLLEILRDSKKFTYQTDPNIIALPMDEATFLSTYYNNYDTLTALGKAITVELYYLHYNLDDSFDKLNNLKDLLNTFEQEANDKSYYLMVSLYSYVILNKILKKKVIDITSNVYLPDYWSNQ